MKKWKNREESNSLDKTGVRIPELVKEQLPLNQKMKNKHML